MRTIKKQMDIPADDSFERQEDVTLMVCGPSDRRNALYPNQDILVIEWGDLKLTLELDAFKEWLA